MVLTQLHIFELFTTTALILLIGWLLLHHDSMYKMWVWTEANLIKLNTKFITDRYETLWVMHKVLLAHSLLSHLLGNIWQRSSSHDLLSNWPLLYTTGPGRLYWPSTRLISIDCIQRNSQRETHRQMTRIPILLCITPYLSASFSFFNV